MNDRPTNTAALWNLHEVQQWDGNAWHAAGQWPGYEKFGESYLTRWLSDVPMRVMVGESCISINAAELARRSGVTLDELKGSFEDES